jgi:hypothetical protein
MSDFHTPFTLTNHTCTGYGYTPIRDDMVYIYICPRVVVATAVTRVTGSGHTATGCITPYHTSKYTFGHARSRVKYIVYVVAGFGSIQRTETSAPSNVSTTTRHVVY